MKTNFCKQCAALQCHQCNCFFLFAQDLRNFACKHVKIIPGENTVCWLPVYGYFSLLHPSVLQSTGTQIIFDKSKAIILKIDSKAKRPSLDLKLSFINSQCFHL